MGNEVKRVCFAIPIASKPGTILIRNASELREVLWCACPYRAQHLEIDTWLVFVENTSRLG